MTTPHTEQPLIDVVAMCDLVRATSVSTVEACEALRHLPPPSPGEWTMLLLLAPDDVLRELAGHPKRPWWRFWP